MSSEQNKKKSYGFTFLELIIVIAIIGIICAMAIPNHRKCTRRHDPRKSCYSNIRVLQGAIEMYNMDNITMMTTYLNLNDLKNGNYIKKVEDFSYPNTPEKSCKYCILGDITLEGQVYCQFHGTVDNTIPDHSQDFTQE